MQTYTLRPGEQLRIGDVRLVVQRIAGERVWLQITENGSVRVECLHAPHHPNPRAQE